MKQFVVPETVKAEEIKAVRKKLKITQQEFAELIGVSKPTVERWEMGKKPVTGPVVLLLQMISHDVDYVLSLEYPEKTRPLRLKYMHGDKLCTIMDVDELRQEIDILNFTDHVMFRAFGANENPSWEDYQNLLKSRCFPENRDKMKLVLKDLDLPFYDPLLIIRKTEGRMAEDDFRILIE